MKRLATFFASSTESGLGHIKLNDVTSKKWTSYFSVFSFTKFQFLFGDLV